VFVLYAEFDNPATLYCDGGDQTLSDKVFCRKQHSISF